jgi:5-methylcytosine-specific restriction endonuclease McrA
MAALRKTVTKTSTASNRHWLDDLPYRALVYSKNSPHGTPLYLVAGSNADASKSHNALTEALRVHRSASCCFYCGRGGKSVELSVDHVDPKCRGGTDSLHNLVIACVKCNGDKAAQTIEAYAPDASRRWLLGIRAQICARLALIPEEDDS